METISSIMLREHKNILSVTDTVEHNINQLEDGSEIDNDFFTQVIIFLREYADGIHHTKEEDILFNILYEEGLDEQDKELKRLIHQHVLSRGLFEEIEKALRSNSKRSLIKLFREYINMIRDHIREEDEVLFPMLEILLNEKAKGKILDQFSHADQQSDIEKYSQMVNKLVEYSAPAE